MTHDLPPHQLPLGRSSWRIWRECVLRSAGFPALGIQSFCDPDISGLASRSLTSRAAQEEFAERWPAAVRRSQEAARALASQPRFREAVACQNPTMVRNCLDVSRFRRRHELAIASYAQRYMLKNDTIGFFGPLAWTEWSDHERLLQVEPGSGLVADRRTYFENWAIDAVADCLSRDPRLRPWLRPRLVGAYLLDGTLLYPPDGSPQRLTPEQAAILARCDGQRSVATLVAELGLQMEPVLAQLLEWQSQAVIHLGLAGPVEARPELTLRGKLEQIGEESVRGPALAVLAELTAARDAVAAAAGDPEATLRCTADLAATFHHVTGSPGTRRPGEAYAGRTLVYQDSERDVTVRLGRPLLELLAPALGVVLDSARWLAARIGQGYEHCLRELFAGCAERSPSGEVGLASLLSAATPLFMVSRPEPVVAAQREFQRRWAEILQIPTDARGHRMSSDAIADQVQTAFPPVPAAWAVAGTHSADILLATADGSGTDDLLLVLGELHLARNTLENRPLVEFHKEPARLLAAVEADGGGRRVYHVPPKTWPQVSPRTYPSPLLSPRFTYWCRYDDTSGAAGPVVPVAALVVHDSHRGLRVRSRVDGREWALLEVIGEQLSRVATDAFRLMPEAGRRPRITIDQLVVQREGWHFGGGDELAWAAPADRMERFRRAQGWRRRHRMPTRVAYRAPDQKPKLVDFRSVALVEMLARDVRQVAAKRKTLTVTEMLPDLDQTWLTDAGGAGYTAELRCVTVDGFSNR